MYHMHPLAFCSLFSLYGSLIVLMWWEGIIGWKKSLALALSRLKNDAIKQRIMNSLSIKKYHFSIAKTLPLDNKALVLWLGQKT